jgi:hypothetical protein
MTKEIDTRDRKTWNIFAVQVAGLLVFDVWAQWTENVYILLLFIGVLVAEVSRRLSFLYWVIIDLLTLIGRAEGKK